MSCAADAAKQALIAALRSQPALAGVALYDGDPAPAVLPRIEIVEPASAEWNMKDRRGRELRTGVILRVATGQRDRLDAMQDAAEAAGEAIDRDLDGWRIASAAFVQARRGGGAAGTWSVLVEHRLRALEI